MSEIKTIKGNVDFWIMPISGKKIHQPENAFYLSTITEEQASLLVDCPWKSNEKAEYKTAKESLFSLLKANGLLAKCMGDISPIYVVSAHRKGQTDVLNIPDDYLLIIKQ